MAAMATILLVDSDHAYRRMVKHMILRHHPEITVKEAPSGEAAMQQARRIRPGLIFTEIDLRGRRTLDLPRQLARANPEGVIAVLTNYDLLEYREAALANGAHHFISKSVPNGRVILNVVASELITPSGGSTHEGRNPDGPPIDSRGF